MAISCGARKYDYPKIEVTDWRVDGFSTAIRYSN